MKTIQGWREEQRAESLLSLREGSNALLKLLQIGKANRHNTVLQAQLLMAGRAIADYMGKEWGFLHDYMDYLEDYQLTTGLYASSREEFLEAVQFDRLMAQEKGKGSVIQNVVGK